MHSNKKKNRINLQVGRVISRETLVKNSETELLLISDGVIPNPSLKATKPDM